MGICTQMHNKGKYMILKSKQGQLLKVNKVRQGIIKPGCQANIFSHDYEVNPLSHASIKQIQT